MADLGADLFGYVDNFAKYAHIKWRCISGDEQMLSRVFITVSIPTYRRADQLKDAIDSALNQENYNDYCVLVVDNDPSEDTETERLLRSYHSNKLLYYKNEENIGMFGNQNRCFEIPKSEYVVLLHDDDLILPNYLSTCAEILKAHPIDALIPGKIFWRGENAPLNVKASQGVLKAIDFYDNYYNYQVGSHSGGTFRKKSFIDVGGYNEEYYPSSDYNMTMIFVKKYSLYKYTGKLSVYRISDNASTKIEVLKKTVCNDLNLRKYVFKECGFSKFVTWIILNYRVYTQAKGLRESYNKDFIFDMKEVGMNVRVPRLLYLPFRLYAEIKINLLKHKILK